MRSLLVSLLFWRALACGADASATRYDVLVQGAVDFELQPLIEALESKHATRIGAWTFWTGHIGGKSVVVSRTEQGPINAAAATALAVDAFHPAMILNQGTAGAHNPNLKLWDIVLGDETTDYGAYKSEHADAGQGTDPARWKPMAHSLRIDGENLTAFPHFAGDARLLRVARTVKYARGKVVDGNIGSAYQYNREIDTINWMHKLYGTDSEDMESAFVAGVAAGLKVPFLAIRIISDSEFTHPKFEKIAGEYCAAFVLDVIRALP